MADLKICRICLRTGCKVYRYDRFNLKPYYEEVMAVKVIFWLFYCFLTLTYVFLCNSNLDNSINALIVLIFCHFWVFKGIFFRLISIFLDV